MASKPSPMSTPGQWRGQPERDTGEHQDDRLDEQRHHVAQYPAGQDSQPAHRGDAQPLDHPGAPVGDDREADEGRAEQAELDQQAGHEVRVGVGRAADQAGVEDLGEERAEESQVQDRLDQPDNHPGRVAQRQAQLPPEDQQGIAGE
jgi:hypothetical protein